MQEQVATPPPTPPTPAAMPTPAIAGSQVTRPLSRQEIPPLRARRGELSDQLASASGRRHDLVRELERTPSDARAGVVERITLLDKRILQLEADIAETGRQLTS